MLDIPHQFLSSKTVNFRFIEVSDAAFIHSLRIDEKYNRFISKVPPEQKKQEEFIQSYKEKEKKGEEFYFIIERKDGVPCGTVRLYNFKNGSFEWGSWILNQDKTKYAAVESAVLIYKIAFEALDFKESNFEVNKNNTGVINFHTRTGAQLKGEDEVNFYFKISRQEAMKFVADMKIKSYV